MVKTDSAQTLIEQLGLQQHPEGGWYREMWRAEEGADGRAKGTAIIFLLQADENSHWHRVDADEMWLWQGGDPLELLIAEDEAGPTERILLGPNVTAGHSLQGLVSAGAWQAARPAPLEDPPGYSLVSCVVVPGFEFSGFELAPPGWEPGSA